MLPRSVIALVALALGIPFLILFAVIASNPGISSSVFSNIIGTAIVMTFVILVVFEIKRIADQPSDPH